MAGVLGPNGRGGARGLVFAIKPPLFALPVVFVAGYYLWRTRSLSLLAAGAVGLLLTAVSLMAFPDYLGEISVVMRELYLPIRVHTLLFLADKGCLAVLSCLGLALFLSIKEKPPVASVLAGLAAMGFMAAYFIQGKYFNYHMAVAVFLVDGVVIAALFLAGFEGRQPIVHNLAWAKDLDRPRALAITPLSGLTLPTARRIGAVWVSRTHSQWIAWYTRFALQSSRLTEEERRRYLYWHERDLRSVLREIREKEPDLIFADTSPEFSWLKQELSAMEPGFLDDYQVVAEENGVKVLRLKTSIRGFLERRAKTGDRAEP